MSNDHFITNLQPIGLQEILKISRHLMKLWFFF